jgi:hypothetical protein
MKKDENWIDVNKWLKNHPVECKYGAPMGDRGEKGPPLDNYRFTLQKLKMVDLCYDLAGTYWGSYNTKFGSMYGYMGYTEDGILVRGFERALNRAYAKEEIRMSYPKARFYA